MKTRNPTNETRTDSNLKKKMLGSNRTEPEKKNQNSNPNRSRLFATRHITSRKKEKNYSWCRNIFTGAIAIFNASALWALLKEFQIKSWILSKVKTKKYIKFTLPRHESQKVLITAWSTAIQMFDLSDWSWMSQRFSQCLFPLCMRQNPSIFLALEQTAWHPISSWKSFLL